MDPRNEKERNLDDIIAKGVVEERIRQSQREQEKNQKKQEVKFILKKKKLYFDIGTEKSCQLKSIYDN